MDATSPNAKRPKLDDSNDDEAMAVPRPWQEIAAEAREHRDSTLALVEPALPDAPSEADLPRDVSGLPKTLLTAEEVSITETPPETLVASLATGELSSVAVMRAFLRRAGVAQKLTNCITELLPERALSRAAELDAYLAEHKSPVGPLHGLPISVKEHIGMAGLRLNAGFIAWWDNVATEDALLLQILARAGAVFYARTTEPQTLMHLETASNYYGATVNPFNRLLTSGGSSGGEGALLGLRGSCLGIGSDIGGSIRSPAANNGLYGLRSTGHRLPVGGWLATMAGSDHITPVTGPLSTSLEGIKLFMKTVLEAKPWLVEPSLLPIAWKEGLTDAITHQNYKIAVLWDDGVVKPHPPVSRALKEVTEKLKSVEDFEVVDWQPYKHDEAWAIIASLYFVDGAADEAKAIDSSGEPWLPMSKHIIKDNEYVKRHSIEDLWDWQNKREMYRAEYAKRWNETATGIDSKGNPEGMIDAILCPVGPGAAPLLETAKWWGYTSQWNLLDYPALVFPVTKVDPRLDPADAEYEPRNSKDEYNWSKYKPEIFAGAPISLQLVGRRYEDEKILGIFSSIKADIGLPFSAYV